MLLVCALASGVDCLDQTKAILSRKLSRESARFETQGGRGRGVRVVVAGACTAHKKEISTYPPKLLDQSLLKVTIVLRKRKDDHEDYFHNSGAAFFRRVGKCIVLWLWRIQYLQQYSG